MLTHHKFFEGSFDKDNKSQGLGGVWGRGEGRFSEFFSFFVHFLVLILTSFKLENKDQILSDFNKFFFQMP